MAREISTPPKERINIKYKPDINSKEEVELPFRLMMIGDYTQREDETKLKDRTPIEIQNKGDFSKILKKQNLSLDINVPNKLSADSGDNLSTIGDVIEKRQVGDELKINLTIEGMKDFKPDSIAKQVPVLNDLLELREALKALRGPLGSMSEFRKEIAAKLDSQDSRDQLLGEITGEEK